MPDVQVPTREKLGQHASYMQEHPLQKRRQMTIKKTKKSHTNAQRSKSAETSRDQESRPFCDRKRKRQAHDNPALPGTQNFITPPSHNTPCRERHWLNWIIWGLRPYTQASARSAKIPTFDFVAAAWKERERNRLLLPRKAAAIREKR